MSTSTGKIVVEVVRTNNNVYVLKEKYESSLWHKRHGNMNFDQIVKLRKKNTIKDFPKLSKLEKTICKSFQLGKLA